MPIRYGYGYDDEDNSTWVAPTDLYYSDLTGDWKVDTDTRYGEPSDDDPDHNPELYVGRVLCNNTAEILKWTKKVLKYEQNPGSFDNNYLAKAFVFHSDQMQDDNQANNLITHFPGFTSTVFEEQPSANSTNTPTFPKGADVVTEMNQNYGINSWFGHGIPNAIVCGTKGYNDNSYQVNYAINGLDNYDSDHGYSQIIESNNSLANLSNYDHLGIVYTVSCYSTPFDDYRTPQGVRNFGECYLGISDGGGPTFLGNTRAGYVYYSDNLQNEFFDRLFSYYGYYNNAGYAEAYSKVDYYNHYLHLSHNLVGCPETRIWTQKPDELSNVEITDNGSSLTVDANVSHSRICVSSVDDGVTFYEVENYVTSHTFNTSVRPLIVTVYCNNHLPYKTIVGGGASIPYSMDFENGLDEFWELKRSGTNGTVGVSMKNGPQGDRHLTMGAIENGTYVTNEAWLHVDLTGHSGYKMIFNWKDFGDETHTQDGIYFSNNGGANFTKVYSLDGGNYSDNTWRQFTIDISQLASNAGLSLTDDFIIKFQQYDNYAISTDGFAFDNIDICFTPTISGGIRGDGSICQYAYDAPYYISDVGDGVSYNWSFDCGGVYPPYGDNYVEVAPTDLGYCVLSVTTSNQCGTDNKIKTIRVEDCGFMMMSLNDSTIQIESETNDTDGGLKRGELNDDTSFIENDKIKLYPNPVSDKLYINYSDNSTLVVKLFDIKGQLLIDKTIESNDYLKVNEICNGLYVIEAYPLHSPELKITKQIIIER